MYLTVIIAWLDRVFQISTSGSSVRTEVLSGITTYMTMSYIVVVNPIILSTTGMNPGAVLFATCLASFVATIWMAIHANYPIALAPGMGQNYFFAFTICGPIAYGGYGFTFQQALAVVVIAGVIFVIGSFWSVRSKLVECIPKHLKCSIAVGIGFLIAMVGFRWGGLVVPTPGTYIGLGDLASPEVFITLFGFLTTAILVGRKIRSALVVGILLSTVLSVYVGYSKFNGFFGLPADLSTGILVADFLSLLRQPEAITAIVVVLVVDVFDTVGTLVGVGERAGLMVKDKLPKARQCFLADAIGSVASGLLGTSTVTSYVESAAGIADGGRTGLSAVVTGIFLAASVGLFPLIQTITGQFESASGQALYPTLAPALIFVGIFMVRSIPKIDWSDPYEAIPSFLTIFMMPITSSITEGLAFGFIATSVLSFVTGRGRQLHSLVHLVSIFFLIRFIWI